MRDRIRQLEEQLSRSSLTTDYTPVLSKTFNSPKTGDDIETSTSTMGGTFYVRQESRLVGHAHAISRTVLHKTRLFGQSHWVNGLAFVSGFS